MRIRAGLPNQSQTHFVDAGEQHVRRMGFQGIQVGEAPSHGAAGDARLAGCLDVADLVADEDRLSGVDADETQDLAQFSCACQRPTRPLRRPLTSPMFFLPNTRRTLAQELDVTMASVEPACARRPSRSGTPGNGTIISICLAIKLRKRAAMKGTFHKGTWCSLSSVAASWRLRVATCSLSIRSNPNSSASRSEMLMNHPRLSASVPSKSKMTSLNFK